MTTDNNNSGSPAQDCGPEDILDMSAMPIDFAEAIRRVDNFKLRFRDKDNMGKELNHVETIPYAVLNTFITGFSSPQAPCTGHYFRGIIISYGMKNGSMINIYQAAIMNSSDSAFPRTYTITAGSQTIYQGGFIQDAAIANYIAGYKSDMMIKRKPGDTPFTSYSQNAGPTVDANAKALLYPLQELTAVWEDNGKKADLFFHTGSRIDPESTSGDIYKHEVFIAPVAVLPTIPKGPRFADGAGDMSYLCPPSCASVTINK